jgi:DNA-binding protein HU-beta
MKSVEEELAKSGKVQLVGFGTFDVRERKERTGRNPRDPKQTINIPASKAPVFKAVKALKETVNK